MAASKPLRPRHDPDDLTRRAARILPEIVELRHSLHRIPETKFEERETSAAIRAFLGSTKLRVLDPLIETDVVGLLAGGAPGPCLLLRSDIDALPVTEASGREWISTHPGKSHACGHDGHAAMLLGAARLLDELSDELAGSVRFVFQPAEEEAGGGKVLIEKGLLELDPTPSAAFALHGWIGMPVGELSACEGPAMAAADRFTISVRGRGGHAALPQRTADPIVAAANLIMALQTVVSRSVDPLEPAVLSICMIHGGQASNVIPDEVELEGTVRYFDARLRGLIRERMQEICAGVCAAHRCAHTVRYLEGYIPLCNDPDMVGFAGNVVQAYLGPEAWAPELPRTMGAEDFAYYLERIPGALLRLGLGEDWPRLHSAEFDFNDEAIEAGLITLAGLALEFCAAEG